MGKEITKWKWKSTIIDFNTISDELADYGDYLTKKDMVFHYLGTPDDKIHEWYNGGYSCEYNSALTYARQLGLVENYIDYEDKIDNLETQLKKQKEIIQKAIEYINKNMEQRLYTGEQYLKTYDCCTDLLQILEDKGE